METVLPVPRLDEQKDARKMRERSTSSRGHVRSTDGVVHGYDRVTVGSFEDEMTDCEKFFTPNYPGFRAVDWKWDYVDSPITCEQCIKAGPIQGATYA